jgi:hypothetical protein
VRFVPLARVGLVRPQECSDRPGEPKPAAIAISIGNVAYIITVSGLGASGKAWRRLFVFETGRALSAFCDLPSFSYVGVM